MEATQPETLKLIQQSAVKADGASGKVAVVPLPNEPGGDYAIVKADGTYELRTPNPGARSHDLFTVAEVEAFVANAVDQLDAKPVVWYSCDNVTVVLDDGVVSSRLDRAVANLHLSEQYKLVQDLGERWLAQRDFIRVLRVKLAGCLGEAGVQAIKILRIIDFNASTAGHSKTEHGRESLGKDLEAEVRSDAGDIPDELSVDCRVFDDPALTRKFPIRCAIEINARDATFNLCPFAGELEMAMDEQVAAIGSMIAAGVECPVFHGSP